MTVYGKSYLKLEGNAMLLSGQKHGYIHERKLFVLFLTQ